MLELNKISKSIKRKEVLKNITFTVQKGQIFGFLGPNGSGKTTTIRIILGLYDPDSGFINNSYSLKEIGFMLDSHGLFLDLTLIENLKLYTDLYQVPFSTVELYLKDLLKKFELYDYKNALVAIFSNGMKQKLSFIRSILHSPKLLILDEPFTGLDPDMQLIMRKQILYLASNQKTTILFSSHNLYEVERLCDQICIIKEGVIKYTNTIKNKESEESSTNLECTYFSIVR